MLEMSEIANGRRKTLGEIPNDGSEMIEEQEDNLYHGINDGGWSDSEMPEMLAIVGNCVFIK